MCEHPRYYEYKIVDDKKIIDFSRPLSFERACMTKSIMLKCGKCDECLNAYTNEWAIRCMHESLYHDKNCCITLTYNDDNVPFEVNKKDIDKFLLDFRRCHKVRYVYTAEYGDEKRRPHYHIILFGYIPDDLDFFFERKGVKYYKSSYISNIWHKGYILVSYLTPQSCRYCCFYLQKNLYDWCDYHGKKRPFFRMSTMPGIGYQWCVDHMDKLISDPHIYLNGKHYHLPRYYQKIIDKIKPGFLDHSFHLKECLDKVSVRERDISIPYTPTKINEYNKNFKCIDIRYNKKYNKLKRKVDKAIINYDIFEYFGFD